MVSGSCACTSITNPKSVCRFPLTSRHESPASSERVTSQCFCMNRTWGRDGCSAMRWTQWPTSAVGSGIYWECRPRLMGCHDLPPSLVRNNPASSTPAYAVSGSVRDGSRCHTRLNSQGCCVPSYHWCVVRGLPLGEVSYTNLLLSTLGIPSGVVVRPPPGVSQVFPPSSERWMTCPNQPLVCEA